MSALVSVITPTWQRNEVLLERCIPSVQDQTYPDIEHLVVSDGPGPDLAWASPGLQGVAHFELPTHDPSVRWGIRARLRGLELAHGDIIVNLDDDDVLRPHAVQALVDALDGKDFAYGEIFMHAKLIPGYVWGSAPPSSGGIPTLGLACHRSTFTKFGAWHLDDGNTDWSMVMRWVNRGATWAFIPDVIAEAYGER
jgi:glycosyltransferase involved in cell wall biosynthesis